MNSSLNANILRFVLLIIFQFLLKEVDYAYIDIYIYPVFILLLPFGMIDGLLILLSFLYGLTVDMIYNTTGLFASAAVFIAAIRPFILNFIEPRGGYENGSTLSKHQLGFTWFAQYSVLMIFFHTLWVVTMEELNIFSLLWVFRLIIIFILSLLVCLLYQFIFNPKD